LGRLFSFVLSAGISNRKEQMSNDQTLFTWSVELEERELFFIGKIVALWGALE
jgi:hypothetical protein